EVFGHEFRHPDASVRCWIPRQIAGVHACSRNDSHKVGHGRSSEMRARGFGILLYIHIWYDHVACIVHIISEQARDVVFILLNDLKSASRSVQSLPASGQLRHTNEHAALVKICPLLSQADLYGWTPGHVVTIPIRDRISRRTSLLTAINSPQIRGIGGVTIVSAACHQQNQPNRRNCLQNTKEGTSHKVFDGVLNAQATQKVKRHAPPCAPGSLTPTRLWFAPLVYPIVHGFVPKLAVLRLQHPMAFVREIQHLGWDLQDLQRGNQIESL